LNLRDARGATRIGNATAAHAVALLSALMVSASVAQAPTDAQRAAYDRAYEGYCETIADFLDTGAHATVHDDPTRDSILLQWGREQGIPGLEPPIPLDKRREALHRVYREIQRRYLPDVHLPQKAPDAGVKVVAGPPRIVMWAPEGKTADIAGEKYRLRHLGGSIANEGRWGQYMFPQISRLRNGQLVVQVYVGGDGSSGRNYLYYLSDDRGKTWQHTTVYDDYQERPATEIVLRLPDGEELRGPFDRDVPRIDFTGLNPKRGLARLGDLAAYETLGEMLAQPDPDAPPGDDVAQARRYKRALVVVNALKGVGLLVDATREPPPGELVDRIRALASDPVVDVRTGAAALAAKLDRIADGAGVP